MMPPLDEIRRRRVLELMPPAMHDAGVDMFIVFTRESTPDPFADEVGLGRAGARTAGVFRLDSSGNFHRVAVTPQANVRRVEAAGIYEIVCGYGREGVESHLADAVRAWTPRRIAVNTSRDAALADGLTKGMYEHLAQIIGPALAARMVSSESIVLAVLSRKFPEEIALIERSVVTIQDILRAVLSRHVIRAGTMVGSIVAVIEDRLTDAGMKIAFRTIRLGARTPDGAAVDDVVQAGELISIDAGAVNDGYCSDIQRTAYLLADGEANAPGDIQAMWDVTLAARRAAVELLHPGSTGLIVDAAARRVVEKAGYKEFPHATGHSLGRRVHDVGPLLGPAWPAYGSLVHARIQSGQVFAVEPMVYAPVAAQGGEVRMGLEENVVVEATGPRILGIPQTRLILVS